MEFLILLALIGNLIALIFSPTWKARLRWQLFMQPTVLLTSFSKEIKTVPVHKLGKYYWVAWYLGIEKIKMDKDGTAGSGASKYKWEPYYPDNSDWFKE